MKPPHPAGQSLHSATQSAHAAGQPAGAADAALAPRRVRRHACTILLFLALVAPFSAGAALAADAAAPASGAPADMADGTSAARVPAGAASGGEYDMRRAVESALRDNQGVAAARAGRDAAEEGRKSARGGFGPAVSTSYSYDRLHGKPVSLTRELDDDTYTWTVGASQPLFTGLNLLSAYQKAALETERQTLTVDKARLDLVTQVQEAFLAYLKAGEGVRSARDALSRLREQAKVTRAFYDVGLRPRLDVLQAEVDLSNAEALLITAENDQSTRHARLNTLLTLPVGSDASYVGTLVPVAFHMTLDQCLERAYRNRPDVRIAGKAVEIAGKDVRIADSGLYPQISANFNWLTEGDHPEASGSTLGPNGFSRWSAGLKAEWNVFEWGRTWYSGQQARQTEMQMRAREANLRTEVAYEVQSRLLALADSAKRIVVAAKGLAQAEEAYRVAMARYQAQVGTNTDVLDAQAKLTAAEAALTGARADYLDALSKLWAAMGELKPALMDG